MLTLALPLTQVSGVANAPLTNIVSGRRGW